MNKKNNKSKVYMIICICILLISVLGSTLAYYREELFNINVSTATQGLDYYINYAKGQDITSAELTMGEDYTSGNSTDIELWKKNDDYTIYGHIYLDINEIGTNLSNSSMLKYAVVNNGTVIDQGSLKGSTTSSSKLIASNILLATNKQLYTVYIWLDFNETIDANIENEVLSVSVRCEATMKPYSLVNHITNLYTSGTPILITQETSNDTYYYSYQDTDKTWGLMNDGLTIDTTQEATTTGLAKVVTDTTALTSGTQGNIRYFGPSDSVNNYIYFNCQTYPDTNCELWRIIGIVDGKVKIIRNDSIGNLAWDQDKNQDSSLTTYSNNWETSSLQLMLNSSYLNGDTAGTITYYSGSSGGTSTSLNMSNIGIKNATTRGMISESIWYLGGKSSAGVYSNEMYTYERTNTVGTTIYSGNPFTINANIGLMYASDYGYATDLSKCSSQLSAYNSSTDSYACRANNWLFNSVTQWLITPYSSNSGRAWLVGLSGGVGYNLVDRDLGVHPVLYLNSELTIESEGNGSSTNPYRIKI